MPANPKYLTKSPWQQFAKLISGIIGGYIISALFHMCLALWMPNHKEVLITTIYTHFILWVVLLMLPYLFKNGWKILGLYVVVIILLYIAFHFGIQNNPFV